MPRSLDSGRLDIAEVYRRTQKDLSARLSLALLVEHASSAGAAAESHWIDLLNRHLPARYRAAQAFVFDLQGRRSRQIDIVLYDHLHAPALFQGTSALHVPSESVRAVFEVKSAFSRDALRDAAEKAASVQALKDSSPRLLAGILAKTSVWKPEAFLENLRGALAGARTLHLGCALDHGAFDRNGRLTISAAEDSLQFFLQRLLKRLDKPPIT